MIRIIYIILAITLSLNLYSSDCCSVIGSEEMEEQGISFIIWRMKAGSEPSSMYYVETNFIRDECNIGEKYLYSIMIQYEKEGVFINVPIDIMDPDGELVSRFFRWPDEMITETKIVISRTLSGTTATLLYELPLSESILEKG